LEVLQDPVQCVKNEHYFCKKCINKHLTRSQTCPVCQDELTPETLRPISRTVANILEQFQSLKCMHVRQSWMFERSKIWNVVVASRKVRFCSCPMFARWMWRDCQQERSRQPSASLWISIGNLWRLSQSDEAKKIWKT
jgi:hypothetical protein